MALACSKTAARLATSKASRTVRRWPQLLRMQPIPSASTLATSMITGDNTQARLTDIRDRALQVSKVRRTADARENAQRILALAHQMIDGVDLNGDEQISPVPGEGGVLTAYQHAQLMAGIELAPRAAANIDPTTAPTPAATFASTLAPTLALTLAPTAVPTTGPTVAPTAAATPQPARIELTISDDAFTPKSLSVRPAPPSSGAARHPPAHRHRRRQLLRQRHSSRRSGLRTHLHAAGLIRLLLRRPRRSRQRRHERDSDRSINPKLEPPPTGAREVRDTVCCRRILPGHPSQAERRFMLAFCTAEENRSLVRGRWGSVASD